MVSIYIKLPKLGANPNRLELLANKFNLVVTSLTDFENIESVFKITNKHVLGLTEFEILTEMASGIKKLIVEEEMCL